MESSTSESGYVDNWQAGKSVTECNLHMLTTEDCSDVIFLVGTGKQVVRAHRYILVSRSCVFHAMFCGPLAEKGEVTIPDIEPRIFKLFLGFLYTDSVDITADSVTGLLYTSRKYAVDGLQKRCITYLESSLSEETVCTILEQCHDYGECDLEKKALKVITEASSNIIQSEGFQNLCHKCLKAFLKSDDLRIVEEDVFSGVLMWAKAECKRQEVDPSPLNIRNILGDIRHDIRFTLMPQEFLVKTVGPSGILTNDERLLILDVTICPDVDVSPFMSAPRKRSNIVLKRFESSYNVKWGYSRGYPDAISFSTNRDIKLVGFQLYGPYNGDNAVYSLTSKLYEKETVCIDSCIPEKDYTFLGRESVNDIFLPKPASLRAGRVYTLEVTLKGEDSASGCGGVKSIDINGIAVSFFKSPLSTNSTTVDRGQIPGLIFQ